MAEKRLCPIDSAQFEATRPDAIYCSDRCRKAASRDRRRARSKPTEEAPDGVTAQSPPAVSGVTLEQSTRDDLTRRGLAAKPLGVAAIALAKQIDGYGEVGSRDGLSALATAHRAFASLLDGLGQGKTAGDRGDELAERREARRREAHGG